MGLLERPQWAGWRGKGLDVTLTAKMIQIIVSGKYVFKNRHAYHNFII